MVTKRKQPLTRYGLRPPEVAEAMGSRVLFEEAERAGFIRPVINRHKLKIYDVGDVARCWARIVAGELPNPKEAATP